MNKKYWEFLMLVGLFLLAGCNSQTASDTQATELSRSSEAAIEDMGTQESSTTEDMQEEQSGILLKNQDFSNGQNRLTLLQLNTQTGDSLYFNEFILQKDVGVSRLLDYPEFIRRQAFDSEYQRVTATKTMTDDQAVHMGYLSSSGEFTDVTAQITEKTGSFSEKKMIQHSPVFGPDDYLYFIEESETIELKRVPLNNFSANSVETVRANLTERSPLYYFDSQGTLLLFDESDKENAVFYTSSDEVDMKKWFTNSEKTNAILFDDDGSVLYYAYDIGFGNYHDLYGNLIGIVDETTYLLRDEGSVYLCQAFEANSINENKDLDMPENWYTADTESRSMSMKNLIPENERNNSFFAYSEKDNIVYFFSKQTGLEAKTELFKVGLDGKEPEKVTDIPDNSPLLSSQKWSVLTAW